MNIILFDVKMEHFGVVFKLDLTDAIARGGGNYLLLPHTGYIYAYGTKLYRYSLVQMTMS